MRDEDDFQSCPIRQFTENTVFTAAVNMASMAAELRTTHVLLGSYNILLRLRYSRDSTGKAASGSS
jgi:hypothetical protein